jgi:hypothetical protein
VAPGVIGRHREGDTGLRMTNYRAGAQLPAKAGIGCGPELLIAVKAPAAGSWAANTPVATSK